MAEGGCARAVGSFWGLRPAVRCGSSLGGWGSLHGPGERAMSMQEPLARRLERVLRPLSRSRLLQSSLASRRGSQRRARWGFGS